MVTSILMRIHLAGEFWLISDEQRDAVHEAIALYKDRIRADIPRAIPFYPLGRPTIEQIDTFNAFGLYRVDTDRAWLAVWRLDSKEKRVQLPLPPGVAKLSTVRQAYPAQPQAPCSSSDGISRNPTRRDCSSCGGRKTATSKFTRGARDSALPPKRITREPDPERVGSRLHLRAIRAPGVSIVFGSAESRAPPSKLAGGVSVRSQ